MKSNRILFTESMQVAELIELNYDLLTILSRFDINLGFGDETISESCIRNGVETTTFLLICNVYTYSDYIPSKEILNNAKVQDIIKYLQNSHKHYIQNELFKLESEINDLVAPCDTIQKKILEKFFNDYKIELENHFDFEEKTVFPYIEKLLSNNNSDGFSIEQFSENHSNIEEKLNDLKTIIIKYLPNICEQKLRRSTLFHICQLEEDLARHTKVENAILTPMVNKLEQRLK